MDTLVNILTVLAEIELAALLAVLVYIALTYRRKP